MAKLNVTALLADDLPSIVTQSAEDLGTRNQYTKKRVTACLAQYENVVR